MNDLTNRISTLSPAKHALLSNLLSRHGLELSTLVAEREVPSPVAECEASASLRESMPCSLSDCKMDFSLFFFSGNGSGEKHDKYELLLDCIRFADQHDFSAAWIPERHFHAFGGLFPNPSVLAAALAVITKRIELRAGSIVLPLHNPIRVVEEWSVVDNLSVGRVALSFASGWHMDDFVLAPDVYENRKEVMLRGIQTVRELWQGHQQPFRAVNGEQLLVATFPRPIRQPLPVWVTTAGNPQTFITAGQIGANLLTGLTGQSVADLADKIKLYKGARAASSHDPECGRVALMLHTYLGEDVESVRETVRQPMLDYLRVNLDLHENLARSRNVNIASDSFSADDEDTLLSFTFDRYFNGGALFGTPDTCLDMVARLKRIGVTEIACLVDFGLDYSLVIRGLSYLEILRRSCSRHQDSVSTVIQEKNPGFQAPGYNRGKYAGRAG